MKYLSGEGLCFLNVGALNRSCDLPKENPRSLWIVLVSDMPILDMVEFIAGFRLVDCLLLPWGFLL